MYGGEIWVIFSRSKRTLNALKSHDSIPALCLTPPAQGLTGSHLLPFGAGTDTPVPQLLLCHDVFLFIWPSQAQVVTAHTHPRSFVGTSYLSLTHAFFSNNSGQPSAIVLAGAPCCPEAEGGGAECCLGTAGRGSAAPPSSVTQPPLVPGTEIPPLPSYCSSAWAEQSTFCMKIPTGITFQ